VPFFIGSLIDAPTAPPGIHNLLTCELEDMPEAYAALMMSPSPATNVEQPLEIEEEEVPQVTAAPGFGRGYSRMTTGIVLVGATILVIIAAMLTAFLITLFNQNKDSPLRQDSLTSRIASPPKKPDELLPIKSASAWGLENPTAAYTIAKDDSAQVYWNFRTMLMTEQQNIWGKKELKDFADMAKILGAKDETVKKIADGTYSDEFKKIADDNAKKLEKDGDGQVSSPRVFIDGKEIKENATWPSQIK